MSTSTAPDPSTHGEASHGEASHGEASHGKASASVCRVPSTEEKLVRVLAGVVSLTGLGLGFFVSPWWYLLTVFAGLNVIQSAFTGFCPPEILYRRLGD
jgi:hypothetical protein